MKECPMCHRPFARKGRWCASCDKPIRARHKWHIDGSVVRHDDCSNPELKVAVMPLLVLGEEQPKILSG